MVSQQHIPLKHPVFQLLKQGESSCSQPAVNPSAGDGGDVPRSSPITPSIPVPNPSIRPAAPPGMLDALGK